MGKCLMRERETNKPFRAQANGSEVLVMLLSS